MLFTKDASDSISTLGEMALIQQIRRWLGSVSPPAPAGIGDDCAVLDPLPKGHPILTTDSISYGQHFDDRVSANHAGAKLIKRNLSDIAAMGGMPGAAVLALLSGPDLSVRWLQNFFAGIRHACEHYALPLVGGDISSLLPGHFSAVLTLTGTARSPRLRSAAQLGDMLYVTGSLGGSILGKHYSFEPRLAEGQWLSTRSDCHAMMDLSDGLGKDLQSLLPGDACAQLKLDQIPVADAAIKIAMDSGREVMEHVFCDGEDYELLFSMDATIDPSGFKHTWRQRFPETPLSCIGSIHAGPSTWPYLDADTQKALPWTQGFEHWK